MQQRRPRLGDIVDDYCPRERRITNHAIVAMIEDEVKQTRCTTCDADHEYKQARVPAQRKKKEGAPVLSADVPAGSPRKRAAARETAIQNGAANGAMHDVPAPDAPMQADAAAPGHAGPAAPAREDVLPDDSPAANADAAPGGDTPTESAPVAAAPEPCVEDEGPVHRPLIRATLPRPEGQVPERKMPDFTVRQPGARGFDNNNNNGNAPRRARPGQRRPARPGVRPQGGNPSGQSTRFGQRHGNAPRPSSGRPTQAGPRHGRPAGENRGGRKRGR
jgi:hypothetical protein